MKKIISTVVIALLCLQTFAFAPKDSLLAPKKILAIMERVGDWQINEFRQDHIKWPWWDWTNGALYTGIVELGKLSKKPVYNQFLQEVGNKNDWNTGHRRFFADDYCVGQLYAQLYMQYKQPVMIAKFQALADSIVNKPHTESLEWKNSIQLREWAWCDALFMGPPALAYLSTATGNPKYLQTADELWWKTTAYLFDSTENLYFRDSKYFLQKEANGAKMFWARGNGWVMGGLVRMLENMPKNYPNRPTFEALFKKMAKKIAAIQHEDGTWHTALLDQASYPSKETSGTGFYAYALTWGIRHGILPKKEYFPVVQKAWYALVSAVHPNGKLGFVQKIGEKPGVVDYNSTEVYGVGAFLLTGSELYRLLQRS
ncbi:rhamnogalacturonyl hydrolase YesR [Chitinophaga skermanii]|uniref:Rhamnogalacturonyl hydrolase YesR n=1 Tax=Chitinophaga skermanii TaxID=331697 RepID=A0A327R3P8_9BACT|nr:glycoside hydrolase family 88 protein [Chitinophaga skermanii]RAJ10678.1 rhamnogalacturonyl hydrolase YesR [Chitinophaga skermanii]